MAENKKSVLLYCDIIHTVEGLEDDEAGRLFKHYLKYINDLNPVAEDRLTTLLFEPIKQNLKRDLKKWESKSEKNSMIAKEAWAKRKDANAYKRTTSHAKNTDKDKVTDKVTVTGKDKVNVKDIKKSLPKNKFSEFKEFKQIFLDFYKLKTGEDYYWTAKDAGKVKSLVSKLKFKIKEKSSAEKEATDTEATKGFTHLLNMIADNWILSNLSMSIIDSKFNEIISNNGKQTTKANNGNRAELEELSRRLKARNSTTENSRTGT